ncbi:MAG: hypothetical protein KKB37_04760 [Alphaproteobacteria bacterium]|nr:hypothetical protein [Alphaproteobacteria bacterium]
MMKAVGTGKNDKPVAGAAAGTFAIFDAGPDGTDYAPFLNPKQHLSRVALHSDLDYLGVKNTMEATVSLPAGSFGLGAVSTYELGFHGQAGKPLLLCEFSANGGANWFTINGITYSVIGPLLVGTSFIIQADTTKVYLFVSRIGTSPAQTLDFRIHILSRNFGMDRPDNGKAFRSTPEYVEAGGGVFDTRRKYLQTPAPGQTPDIVHVSGATVQFAQGDEGGGTEIDAGFGSHSNNFNMPLAAGMSTSWPPYITQPPKIPLVFLQPGNLPARARFQTGSFKLSNAAGEPVLDTAQKLVSFVGEFRAEGIVVPSRAAVSGDLPHREVRYAQPMPAGADMIFGWLEMKTATVSINTNRPLDFSGALLMSALYNNVGTGLFVRAASMIYPRLNNGNIEIVEHYFNRAVAGTTNSPLPSYTFDVHMFVAARTGGLS